MAEPFKVEGVPYDREGVLEIRRQLIVLRDAALKTEKMDWTMILSHAIAQLAYFAGGGVVDD